MDMMYMPDALAGYCRLDGSGSCEIVHRNAFNVSAMSFEPSEIAA